MRVKCENCNTNFKLDEGLVKSTGSKVRCSKCKHVFIVYPSPPAEEEPAMTAEQGTGETLQVPEDEAVVEEAPDVETREDSDVSAPTLFGEASSEETAADDMDLSDIEKMLDAEEKAETPATVDEDSFLEGGIDSGVEDESLDLSDIEKILDEHDDNDELIEEKSDEDQDLIFDLDEEIEMEAGEEAISPATELDLGDLEKMFESEEDQEPSTDEEPSLSLGSEAAREEEMVFEASDEAGSIEEPSLESVEEAAASEPEEAGEALGFDIEPDEADEDAQKAPDEEFPTLDLDFDVKDEDIALEEEPEAPAEDTEDLDLEATIKIDMPEKELQEPSEDAEALDLEATIKLDSEALTTETEELGLSMEEVSEISDMDEDVVEAEASLGDELEIELEGDEEKMEDVGGISEEALESEAAEGELTDFGEDVDLDFPDDAVPDIPDEDEDYIEEEEYFEDTTEEEEDFEEVAVAPRPKSGLTKILFGLLVAILLIVIVFAALVFLQYRGILDVPYLDQIQIPFLTNQKTSALTSLADLKIEAAENRPLNSEKAGRLFIITGVVKNESSVQQSYIQVSGSLFTPEKKVVDTATSYCGNVIADMELDQMTPAAIRTRLGRRSGDNNSNVNVAPGKSVPFMIVFFDPQENLDECGVSVAGSTPGGK